MSDPIIAVEHVTRAVTDSTGTLTILHDIDFTLQRRQSTAIVGASPPSLDGTIALSRRMRFFAMSAPATERIAARVR